MKGKNMKVRESESTTNESSNQSFHHAPWGIPRGLFIGQLGVGLQCPKSP
jgi:hypothetical protein